MKTSMLVTSFLIAATAFAQQQPPPSDDKEMQELLSIVQQETAVATKTRLNSDYVPGTVTVLESDELEALGVRTAGEALGLVPGMQWVRDQSSSDSVIVRGLDFPFNAGNIQVLLDGVPIARQDGGVTTSALLIPIEQIERIEVIRGPGSVVYGDFAFMGLVNIMTRKEGTRAAARYEWPSSTRLGVLRTAVNAPAHTVVTANAARLASSDSIGVLPQSPFHEQRTFGMFGVRHGGFDVRANVVRREYTPPATAPFAVFHERSWASEAKYATDLRPALHAEAKISRLQNDISNYVFSLDGNITKVTLETIWTGWSKQSWLVSADRSRSHINDAAFRLPPPPGQPPPANQTPLVSGVSRDITGVTLQDRIDVTEKVSVTAGARYDSYSDLESRVTPRLAAVWRVSDRHILKAQYAEGFRPPTFFELYTPAAPNITPSYPFEINSTTEAGYVYHGADRAGRVTLFRSILSKMIRPGGVTFNGSAEARGIEAEWSQQISPLLKFESNATHVNTTDPRGAVPGTPNAVSSGWYGNAAFLLRPISRTIIGARWNYTGDRVGGAGFSTVDFTVTRQDVIVPGLAVRGGVKNASNERVTYLVQLPTGPVNTFAYPRRAVWAELSWRH